MIIGNIFSDDQTLDSVSFLVAVVTNQVWLLLFEPCPRLTCSVSDWILTSSFFIIALLFVVMSQKIRL